MIHSLVGIQVLIVEDEELLRNMLHTSLEEVGATVTSVASAEAAKLAAKKSVFHVVVTDFHLNNQTGLDLMRELSSPSGPRFVLCTGELDIQCPTDPNLIGVLQKPFSRRDLIGVLTKADLLKTGPLAC